MPYGGGTKNQHGFVSLFGGQNGELAAVWLDGREGAGHANPQDPAQMALRYATIMTSGSLADEAVLDARVCDCCQTSAAVTAAGPLVVYRDRSDEEVRDISAVLRVAGKWTQPRPVSHDKWQINGCPVNGPAVVASGRRVGLAWFTGANDTPHVKLAFSNNAGETFGKPIEVDNGNPAGRVSILLTEDGGAVVSWIEKYGGGDLRVRHVGPVGKLDDSLVVAPCSSSRATGFPRMARSGKTLIFAWTGTGGVLTASLAIPQSWDVKSPK